MGAAEEGKGYDNANRAYAELGPIADDIRETMVWEAEQTRKRTAGAAEDIYGRVTKEGERITQGVADVQGLQGEVVSQLQGVLAGDFEKSAGYEFTRSEALRGVERGASARGANRGGGVLAELGDRAAGVASTEYTNMTESLRSLLGTTGQITGQANQQRAGLTQGAGGIYSDLFRTGESLSADLTGQGLDQFGALNETSIAGRADAMANKGKAKSAGIGALTEGASSILGMFGD
jgi:hypothetical protein